MSIEEYIKIYEELQRYKRIVANIDKDFFFKFVDNLLSDYTRQKQINEEHQKTNGELRKKVKELEKENTTLRRVNNITKDIKIEDITQLMNKSYKEFINNFISKQKIKDRFEKIQLLYEKNLKEVDLKEVQKIDKKIFEGIRLEAQRDFARELLQESEETNEKI